MRRFLALLSISVLGAGGMAQARPPMCAGPLPSTHGVHVLGAVRQPIHLQLGAPVPLLQAVMQAGGLRGDAYAAGAVLLRPMGAVQGGEVPQAHKAAAAWQISAGTAADNPTLLALSRNLVTGQQYVRIPVIADSARLRANPHLEPVMLPGDVLVIPSRPRFVAVVGAVDTPGLYAHESGLTARDYVKAAGGFARGARRSGARSIAPDGEVQSLHLSAWNYQPETLMPGSVIYVPERKNPTPLVTALRSQLNLGAVPECSR